MALAGCILFSFTFFYYLEGVPRTVFFDRFQGVWVKLLYFLGFFFFLPFTFLVQFFSFTFGFLFLAVSSMFFILSRGLSRFVWLFPFFCCWTYLYQLGFCVHAYASSCLICHGVFTYFYPLEAGGCGIKKNCILLDLRFCLGRGQLEWIGSKCQ